MSHSKTNQKGFGVVESLLVVVILLIVGFIGYYIWHARTQVDKTLDASAKTSQLATGNDAQQPSLSGGQKTGLANGLASFILPKGWVSARPASICSGTTDNVISCLDSVESAPVNVAKAQIGDAFGVDVALLKVTDGKNAHDWYFDDYLQALQDSSYTISPENVNGLQGIHVVQTTNSYTDESYVLRKGDNVLLVQSRVSETGYTPGGTAVTDQQDNTKYMPNIKQLAASALIR